MLILMVFICVFGYVWVSVIVIYVLFVYILRILLGVDFINGVNFFWISLVNGEWGMSICLFM